MCQTSQVVSFNVEGPMSVVIITESLLHAIGRYFVWKMFQVRERSDENAVYV